MSADSIQSDRLRSTDDFKPTQCAVARRYDAPLPLGPRKPPGEQRDRSAKSLRNPGQAKFDSRTARCVVLAPIPSRQGLCSNDDGFFLRVIQAMFGGDNRARCGVNPMAIGVESIRGAEVLCAWSPIKVLCSFFVSPHSSRRGNEHTLRLGLAIVGSVCGRSQVLRRLRSVIEDSVPPKFDRPSPLPPSEDFLRRRPPQLLHRQRHHGLV